MLIYLLIERGKSKYLSLSGFAVMMVSKESSLGRAGWLCVSI